MSLYFEEVPIDEILLGMELQEIIEKCLSEAEREQFYQYLSHPTRKPSKRIQRIIEKIRQLHEQKVREVVYGYPPTSTQHGEEG